MDAGISGELFAAFQKLLYGAAVCGLRHQRRAYYAGTADGEPPGCGRAASGDEPDSGRDHGTDLQYQRGYGAGTGYRKAPAAHGRAGA